MNFTNCIQEHIPKVEPIMASDLPDYQWQRGAVDLFELKNRHFVLVVDYYAKLLEVC